ncbi:sigma-70 family RNA polymerase sigma factor [Candidatus Poribacteria bacterium]|nr:sigma-70 family RNA polymerase sigma factor [Candidatus Poribacteria bacterium]
MVKDDVQLIQRILSGDDAAFTVLVRKHQKSVHALAWRKVGDFHCAEEITQDTFLQVYKKLATLKDPRQFSGWLYVMTNRICSNWMRKNNPALQSLEMTPMEDLEKSAYARYVSEQREIESTEHRHQIAKRLLEKLPESERTVMTLYYLGEMTTREISRFLGVSVHTITSRLQRAEKRLQQDEEHLVQEMLGRVQLPDSLMENIVQGIADMKPIPPTTGKPLLPWAALGAAAILVLLLLGISNKYLARFQRPYNFEAASEPTIEIIEAPIVLETDAKPAKRNQIGRATTTGKISNTGLHGTETVSTPKAPLHPEATDPWMPDPALRDAIREELALPAVVPLTKETLLQLRHLHTGGKGITDLKGLEFAHNLVNLHLGNAGNYITDLSPLATLISLTYLNVGGNQVVDLKPLTNLTHLTGLSLWNNQVTDISPLSSLTALTYLNLADNYVTDLRPLANLTQLESLDLWGLSPDAPNLDLHPLAGLINLEKLSLGRNRIADVHLLAGLRNLRTLKLAHNDISDIRPLAALTNLEELSLQWNKIADIYLLGELKSLRTLNLSYNDISHIPPLANLTQLRTLWIKENPLTDFTRLSELNLTDLKYDAISDPAAPTQASVAWIPDPALRAAIRGELGLLPGVPLTKEKMLRLEYLYAERKDIHDITGLGFATHLRELHLNKNPITDLQPLVNLTKLEVLHLRDIAPTATTLNLDIYPLQNLINLKKLTLQRNGISDISPLSRLTQLQTLEIEGNPITDLSPLFGLNLRELDVSNSPLIDLRQLANLTSLEYLCLEKSQISDISPLAGLNRLRILDIRYNVIENIQPLTGLVTLRRLWIQGNPIVDFSPLAGLPLTDFRHDQVSDR